MTRLVTLVLAASFCVGSLLALGRGAYATPPIELPGNWAAQAIDTLAAHGVIDGYPDESYRSDRPLTRPEMARLVARAIAKLRANGVGTTSIDDLAALDRLMGLLQDELIVLGLRAANVDEAIHPRIRKAAAPSTQVHGALYADNSYTQWSGVPKTISGGSADPFVNAFLTSPTDNNPFEHGPGPGTLVRGEGRLTPTYTVSDGLSISLPTRIIQYAAAFTNGDRYLVQPAIVLNFGKTGAFRNLYVRGGQLDNLESSRLGLTYRAPDATQEGPGFQNPVQPYENGIQVGGTLNGLTRFQFSLAQVDQSAVESFADQYATRNYFLIDTPSATSLIQPGAQNSTSPVSRTDTYIAGGQTISTVFLSMKAQVGTVFISAVNGVLCNSAGFQPSTAPCPIGANAWSYIDQTNQVVFRAALPAGTVVQISYTTPPASGTGSSFTYNYQRYHFNARLNQGFKGWNGAEIGLSLSRLFDSGVPGAPAGFNFGTGFGALSDTVFGLDARLPLPLKLGHQQASPIVLFGEGAYSKYTPDARNTPAITDSAIAAGLRLNIFTATAIVQYQRVGPDFMAGGPLRELGPGPATFQFWRGAYFPGFYGFANNLAINTTFDTTVTPGCAGTACTRQNGNLTYIYPVFNPFVATGPQFYSAFAPNSNGFTAKINAPLTAGSDVSVKLRLLGQHLTEITPNSIGQITYGPGFSSGTMLKFDKIEGGLQVGLPILGRNASLDLSGSTEHLVRNDKTAYAYVPFNPMTGGPDASSGAALNAFLSLPGNTPVLFFPNYIDDLHMTYATSLSLPLTADLNFAFGYNTQTFRGAYGTTVGQNIMQRKDAYGGTLSFHIPKTKSSIGFMYGNQSYTDSVQPTYNFSQNREDLTYSIRF